MILFSAVVPWWFTSVFILISWLDCPGHVPPQSFRIALAQTIAMPGFLSIASHSVPRNLLEVVTHEQARYGGYARVLQWPFLVSWLRINGG